MDQTQFAIIVSLIVCLSVIPWILIYRTYKKAKPHLKKQTKEKYKLKVIQEVTNAIIVLKTQKVGCSIIIDSKHDVFPHVANAQLIDSTLFSNLIVNIFEGHTTPLHDGAILIGTDGRLKAASAYIKNLSTKTIEGKKMGTRHRSALGLTEVSAAIVVVLSEETGKISIFKNGKLFEVQEKDLSIKLSELWV